MSTVAPAVDNRPILEKHHFLLRRLHSLTGIVPIGVFLIAHLTTNSSILWGGAALRGEHVDGGLSAGGVAYFWKEVKWINEQIPHLLLIEVVLWLSLAFHSILGFIYARSGKSNVSAYGYQSNKRYAWQRISGYVGILYIFYHVATLRWGWSFLIPGGTQWSHHFSASTMAMALRGAEQGWTAMGLVVSVFYLLGVSLLVYHFANGLWTAAITWGLTITAAAQKRWGYVCFALGVGLMFAGWSSVIGFAVLDPKEARAVEIKLLEKSGADLKIIEGLKTADKSIEKN
jgi:succinate dehydrogenase / fumarate reductase, cytochrome b subunit